MSEIRNREFLLYIRFFAVSFSCFFFSFSKSSAKKNREFRLYICFFAASFSCFSFSLPSLHQIRNRDFFLYICFFAASFYFAFYFFSHETKFHSSNSSILCQLQLPSPQLHLTRVLLYHIHVETTLYTALPGDDDDNDGATETEQMELGEGQQGRMKKTPIHNIICCA